MPRQATRGQPGARLTLPSGSRLRPFLMVSCTYPAPFHAHTHFLATVCGILVLDAAPQAPAPLCAIALLQDLHHLCLVDRVNALQTEGEKEVPYFALLCSFPLAICYAITVLGPGPSLSCGPIAAENLQHKKDGAKCHPALSSPCLGSQLSEPPHQDINHPGRQGLATPKPTAFFLHVLLCEGFCCPSVFST